MEIKEKILVDRNAVIGAQKVALVIGVNFYQQKFEISAQRKCESVFSRTTKTILYASCIQYNYINLSLDYNVFV